MARRKEADSQYQKRGMLVLAAFVLLVYGQTLSFDFTNWDDPALVVDNPAIRSIGLDTVVPRPGQAYQPVRVLSYAIDYAIWGTDTPGAYHFMNMLLHASASILLFLALQRMLPLLRLDPLLALPIAGLFAVHPVNVESVAWVASRKYVLLANFAFLALYAYCRDQGKWRLVVPVATLLAILSSPFGIVIPALLSLLEFCRHSERKPKRLLPAWAVFVLLAPVLWWVLVGTGADGERVATSLEVHANLWTMLRCLFDYASMLMLPWGLNNKYVDLLHPNPWHPKVLLSIVGLCLLAWWVFREYKKGERLPLFCAGWFFIAWAPVSNLVPISTTMADRYLYLPAIGLFIALAPLVKRQIIPVFAILILLAAARTRVWKDSAALWQDSLSKAPNSPIAHNSLGEHLMNNSGQVDAAIEHFRKAIDLYPDAANAHSNLGAALRLKDDLTGALHHLEIARKLAPALPAVHLNLGGVYYDAQRYVESRQAFERLLELRPDTAIGWFGLGLTLERLNSSSQAIGAYQQAIKLNLNEPSAHNNLGALLAARGDHAGAIAEYGKALRLFPEFADALYNRGVAEFANGNPAQAMADYKQAITVNQQHARALNNLGTMYRDAGQLEQAIHLLQRSRLADPSFELAGRNLAAALRLAGRDDEAAALALPEQNSQYDLALKLEKAGDRNGALAALRKAIEAVPGDVRAHNGLAWRLLQHPAPSADERRESLTHAQRAAELTRNSNPRVLLTLALAWAANENYPQSRNVANAALALNPPEDVRTRIANLLQQLPQ
jgi:tetratricopeptide (TPR) repeat protein